MPHQTLTETIIYPKNVLVLRWLFLSQEDEIATIWRWRGGVAALPMHTCVLSEFGNLRMNMLHGVTSCISTDWFSY